MAQNYNSNWIQNYDFIELPSTNSEYINRTQRRDSKHNLSGILKVRLITADPLFIGSGFQELEGNEFVNQTLNENGRPVIPGSGLKGAVRQICRAVSESCVPKEFYKLGREKVNIKLPKGSNMQCASKQDSACIMCDMFGKMGWSSKVFFGDLIADSGKTERYQAAQLFAPHPNAEKYLDNDGCHRFKFYYTDIRSDDKNYPQHDLLRAVPPKTVFTSEITYRNLDERELELLMFGLGQSGTFSLKLGGYRNEGFGTVNLTITSDTVSDTRALANSYIDSVDDTIYKNIVKLEHIMAYKT